mmetsp:Transcript_4765/g.12522  ORF Transcript_4765/g.12522 Transcript_4765/m.12522 type:complete len:371 (-) Transcript_4765:52-1164(-)
MRMATCDGLERLAGSVSCEWQRHALLELDVQFLFFHHLQNLSTALGEVVRHGQHVRWQLALVEPRVQRSHGKIEEELHRLPHRGDIWLGIVACHRNEHTASTTWFQHAMRLVREVSATDGVDDLVEWLFPFHLPPVLLLVIDDLVRAQRLAERLLSRRGGNEGCLGMRLGHGDGGGTNTAGPAEDQDTISCLHVVQHCIARCDGTGAGGGLLDADGRGLHDGLGVVDDHVLCQAALWRGTVRCHDHVAIRQPRGAVAVHHLAANIHAGREWEAVGMHEDQVALHHQDVARRNAAGEDAHEDLSLVLLGIQLRNGRRVRQRHGGRQIVHRSGDELMDLNYPHGLGCGGGCGFIGCGCGCHLEARLIECFDL